MIGSDCPNCGWSDPENEHAKTQESIQEFKTRMQSRRGRYGGGYYGW
jgi:hypothetical protein